MHGQKTPTQQVSSRLGHNFQPGVYVIVVTAQNPVSAFNYTIRLTVLPSLVGLYITDHNRVSNRNEPKDIEIGFQSMGSQTCLKVGTFLPFPRTTLSSLSLGRNSKKNRADDFGCLLCTVSEFWRTQRQKGTAYLSTLPWNVVVHVCLHSIRFGR